MSDGLLDPRELPPRSRATALLLLGAVLLCAAAGQLHFDLAQAARTVQYEQLERHRRAALLWDAVAVVATLALCRWTRRWRLAGWPGAKRWLAALAVVTCGALGLRLYRLAELPPGLWVDEALNGVQAVQIAASGRPLIALPPEDVRTGLGAGYVDIAALAFALVDPNDGPYALRVVTVVIGTLGVATLGALAWELFGPRAALAAAAWLAVSQWHVNYSRWGEMPVMSSVVETLIVLAAAIAWRTHGWRAWCAFLIAGAAAGAGLYTYQTYRLFAVLAGICALLLALAHAPAIAARWRPLAAALLLAALVAAPMVRYAIAQPEAFGERAEGTLIFGRADWWEQLRDAVPRSLLAFQLVGDDNPRHNLPFAPLLSSVPALLAPIGLAVCLARWRALRYAIVPLWFAVALVPGMITLEAPHASRLLDAIVPIALMIGVAVDLLLGVLQAALPPRFGLRVGAVAVLLAGVWTAVAEYRAYFVARPRLPEFVEAFAPWESAPARYLAAHAPTATVFLDPSTYWSPATEFVAHRYLDTLPADVRMLRVQHDFPPPEPLPRGALYLLPRPYAPVAEVIRGLWTEARCEEERDAFGRIDLVACRVPPSAVAAPRAERESQTETFGLRGRFYRTLDGSDPPVEAWLVFPYCEYRLDEPPLGPFRRAEWDGFIDIAQPGEYAFRLHPDSTTLTIGGRQVIADAGASGFGGGHDGRVVLPSGRLPIHITLDPGSEERYFLWFLWQPPHGQMEIVPAAVLHPPGDG
jgi:hypothetical protein